MIWDSLRQFTNVTQGYLLRIQKNCPLLQSSRINQVEDETSNSSQEVGRNEVDGQWCLCPSILLNRLLCPANWCWFNHTSLRVIVTSQSYRIQKKHLSTIGLHVKYFNFYTYKWYLFNGSKWLHKKYYVDQMER